MAKKMNDIIRIFMERDGETYEDALAMYKRLKEEVQDTIESYEGFEAYEYVEDILAMYSLEMDYVMDLI